MARKLTNKLSILHYLHCGKCIKQKPLGVSMSEWGGYDIGWTKLGLQVWCKKHQCNIMHIDFEGQQHPANLTALKEKDGKLLLS